MIGRVALLVTFKKLNQNHKAYHEVIYGPCAPFNKHHLMMALIKIKKYNVVLEKDYSEVFESLKGKTDISESIITNWTNKDYRGKVNINGFHLISSELGVGDWCVFKGSFVKNKGEIEVTFSKMAKAVFYFVSSVVIIGGAFLFHHMAINLGKEWLLFTLISLTFFRIVRELFFSISRKNGLKMLKKDLRIMKIEKT